MSLYSINDYHISLSLPLSQVQTTEICGVVLSINHNF